MTVKFLRSSIRRQMHLEYVRTAKSKGNSKKDILVKHVLKNALIPVITFLGMIIADVLAGSIIVEQVFNLPGLGRLLVVAISSRDYAVVQAVVLYIAAIVVVINLFVDVLYRIIDPRISKEEVPSEEEEFKLHSWCYLNRDRFIACASGDILHSI